MPEYPEVMAIAHLLRQGKGFPGPSARYHALKVSDIYFHCRLIFSLWVVHVSTYPALLITRV